MNKGTILVVDDTLASLQMLSDILIAEGYEALPANSGELALVAIAVNRPDLILLDLRMPGMDGFEVLRRLKAQPETRDAPPVIVLTAAMERELRLNGLKLGAVDFISKPFQIEELLAKVRTHVALSQVRAKIERQAADLEMANTQLQTEVAMRRSAEDALRVAKEAAEAGLVKEQALMAAIVESSEDAIVGKTLDGIVTSWNRGATTIFGYSAQDMLGRSVTVLVPPERQGEEQQILAAVRRDEPVRHFETQRLRKDGRKIDVSITVSPIRNAEGEVVGASKIVRDITDRKRIESELERHRNDLEQLVAGRTADLEAANYELEAFSYSVSHDLRTPLRAIDGFSRLLLGEYSDKLDDEGKRLLNVVRDNTKRMGQLIDDILNFSRSGRLELSFSDIDMENLARAVFNELQPAADDDKRQLEIGAIPHICGDGAMMRQVFVNLLSNAIKFSRPKAAAKIQVGGSVACNEAIYFVKDNGVGFDMRYADGLFGVFKRLHGVTEFEGTGIGLAIVKRIVTRHGGRVWAEGKVNEGATIYFALPIQKG